MLEDKARFLAVVGRAFGDDEVCYVLSLEYDAHDVSPSSSNENQLPHWDDNHFKPLYIHSFSPLPHPPLLLSNFIGRI